MGAWGCGPLDNDTAADLMLDPEDASPSEARSMIQELLEAAEDWPSASSDGALVALAHGIANS